MRGRKPKGGRIPNEAVAWAIVESHIGDGVRAAARTLGVQHQTVCYWMDGGRWQSLGEQLRTAVQEALRNQTRTGEVWNGIEAIVRRVAAARVGLAGGREAAEGLLQAAERPE